MEKVQVPASTRPPIPEAARPFCLYVEAVGVKRPVGDVSCSGKADHGNIDRPLRTAAPNLQAFLCRLEGTALRTDEVLEEGHDVAGHPGHPGACVAARPL